MMQLRSVAMRQSDEVASHSRVEALPLTCVAHGVVDLRTGREHLVSIHIRSKERKARKEVLQT